MINSVTELIQPLLAHLGFVELSKFLDLLLEAGDGRQVLSTVLPAASPHLLHLAEQVAEPVVEVNEVLLLFGRRVEHATEWVHVGMAAAIPTSDGNKSNMLRPRPRV